MLCLQDLGWNDAWSTHFAAHAPAGCFPGRIAVEHKGLYHYYGACGEGLAQVRGRLRYEAGGRGDFPGVGDWVALSPTGDADLAIIQAILPRNNKFSRKVAGDLTEEQIIAANLDTLLLITSLNRDFNPRRLERYLTAATLPDVQPVLVLTKSDLCDEPDPIVAQVRELLPDVAVHAVSAVTGVGLAELDAYLLPGRTLALVGSSGVGKSTLVNRLLGENRQAVSAIRATDDRGRHTTTRRELLRLPQGALLIDSPGMRELQLWEDADPDDTFADIAALAAGCFFADCTHGPEPRCAVKQALADGRLDTDRWGSYEKLKRELSYLETRQDGRAARERKEQERRIHRVMNKAERRRRC